MEAADILLSVGGFTCLWALLFFLAPFVFRKCAFSADIYSKLTNEKQVDLCLRATSIISASCAWSFGAWNLNTNLSANAPLNEPNNAASLPLIFMTAFFTLDTIVCIYLRKEYGATTYQYLCHHAVAILGFYNSLKYQECLWFANYRLLSELSTPLINVRAIMNAFNLKETYAGIYSANRVCTMLAFFVSRIATIPYFWMLTYRRYDDLMNCDWKIIGMLILSGIVLDFLNIQWFVLILKIASVEFKKIPKIAKEKTETLKISLREKKDNVYQTIQTAKTDFRENVSYRINRVRRRLSAMRPE